MGKDLRKNVMLGLFVAAGLLLFIIGIFLVGSKSEMFSKTFNISVIFKNAAGLKKGGNVRFNGVKVGIVKNVTLINDTTIQVDLKIENTKKAFICKNAIATITSDGLMGDKFISIINGPSGSPVVHENDFIKGRNPINTDLVFETLNGTNNNINIISENLKILTDNLNNKNGTLQALYKDTIMALKIRQSVNNLQSMSADVTKAGNDLKRITAMIRNGEGSVGKLITDTTLSSGLEQTVVQLKNASEKLNKVSDEAQVTLSKINSGSGTVNTLLTDQQLSEDVKQSVVNIKTAADNLNQNLEALKHSFLLRGYFKKKAKEKK